MMPSLPKLIALVLVLWTVWKVFRIIERRGKYHAVRPMNFLTVILQKIQAPAPKKRMDHSISRSVRTAGLG